MAKKKEKGNGEGTMYKSNKTGLYIGQYVYNGKRHSVYQKKDEKIGDFKKRFVEIINSINNDSYIEKNTDSIIDILNFYVEQKHNDHITSDRSYVRDLETIEQIKRTCSSFCNIPIQKVTIKQIEKAKHELRKYSQACINKIWRDLNKAFSIASSPSQKIILYNLLNDENLRKPISDKQTKKITALTQEEFDKLNNILDNEERNHQYRNIIKMQCISGMRIGEVLARSIDDYNSQTQEFNVHNSLTIDSNHKPILSNHTKTFNKSTQIDEGQRYLPLNNSLFEGLIEIIQEQKNNKISNIYKLLFWDYKKDTFVTQSEIRSYLRRINTKYNIVEGSLSSHRLRHTAITYWKELGIDMTVIQYLAGHVDGSNITLDTYIDTRFNFVKKELKKIKNI